jgi:hypothetical protein
MTQPQPAEKTNRAETRHTPGPWRVNGFNKRGDRVVGDLDGGVANVYCEEDSVRADPIGEANAHLIAAAPDLLDACKLAHSYFHNREGRDLADLGLDASKALTSAIAKAEGR